MLTELSDEELINGCLAGIPSFQQALYKRFAATMYAVCLRYSKDKEEAKDILQDGFILVFDKLSQFRKQGSFEGWIRKIMVNKSLEYCRKSSFLFQITGFKGKELENELIDKENVLSLIDSKELLKMIQELSPVYKMIFNMYVFEDMGHREIAKVLNITEGTSRKNLSDARNVLKKKINQTMALDKKIAHNDRRANG